MTAALALALERAWYRPARAILLLLPLEWLFIGLSALRRLAFRRGWKSSYRVACPVVVVGNISVGGTGKTPVVIALARAARDAGVAVAVISRGYGGSASGPLRVDIAADPAEVGDEALLIAQSSGVPVFVASDRVLAAQAALAEVDPQLILSDDGLQHYALERDVEIVIIDAQRGFGNGHRLPVGPLREAPQRLASVDYCLQRGGSDPLTAVRYEARGFRSLAGQEFRDAREHGLGPKVHAVAGIANPQRFFELLRTLGLDPMEHSFPDHHAFSADDLRRFKDLPVVMTAKDAVKCGAVDSVEAWVLEIDALLPDGLVSSMLARAGIHAGVVS